MRCSRRPCIRIPYKRYEELSEFVFEPSQPEQELLNARPAPLIERNPLLFWKCLSLILAFAVLFLLYVHYGR